MHMAGWNTGKKCDTLMYVCRFRVACFRSMANRKAFTTSSCESKCAGLLLPLFLSVDRIAVVNLHLPEYGSKTAMAISLRNVSTLARHSQDMSSRHVRIDCICFTSLVTPCRIT